MIERGLRDCLADNLHAFAAGFITNVEFEVSVWEGGAITLGGPTRCPDPAIGPISEFAWGLCSDLSTYRLTGRLRLSPDHRREVLRWILFLRSDMEYEWPRLRPVRPFWASALAFLTGLLTLGILPHWQFVRRFSEWQRNGDYDVWPFLLRSDYESVSRRYCPFGDL